MESGVVGVHWLLLLELGLGGHGEESMRLGGQYKVV